jgi:Domain of unknown function (DUF4345)
MSTYQSSSVPFYASWTLLQIVLAVLSLIPIATGILALHGVHNLEYAPLQLPRDPFFDSNLRFLGGVWFGLGLVLWWLLPRVRSQAVLLRALAFMIFIGGIGRVISWLMLGLPAGAMAGVVVAVTLLELVGMPALIAWHAKLASLHREAA